MVFQQLDCDPLTLIQSRTFPRMSANALITALNCNAHLSPFSLSCTTCNVHTAIMHLVMHRNIFTRKTLTLGCLVVVVHICMRLPARDVHCGVVIYRFRPKCIIFHQHGRKHLFSIILCNCNWQFTRFFKRISCSFFRRKMSKEGHRGDVVDEQVDLM